MCDEEVIKRRLLIDGDGTGDDRRLNVLHKSIHKWCSQTDDNEYNADKLLIQIAQCQFSMRKARKGAIAAEAELENYKNLAASLQTEIETQKIAVTNAKAQLMDAQRVRSNRMQYEVLGKVIAEEAPRKQSAEQVAKLEAELKKLENTRNILKTRMDQRRRRFHGLLLMAHQLLDEQEEIADQMNTD